MNRLALTILTILILSPTVAFAKVNTPPLTLGKGECISDTIKHLPSYMAIHTRAKSANWAVKWNVVDDKNFSQVALSYNKTSYTDELSPKALRVEVKSVVDGIENILAAKDIYNGVDPEGYNSIKIVQDTHSCTLWVGAREATKICVLPSVMPNTATELAALSDTRCTVFRTICFSYPEARSCEFDNLGELYDHVHHSSDPCEAIWELFDRETDTSRASIGGKYTIATVKNDEGGYNIVYISGADTNSRMWTPLDIKGTLTGTIFTNDYDLLWLDSYRNHIDLDANASISDDFAILTLKFPMQSAQVRFRRKIE